MDNLGLIEDIIGKQNYPTPITSDLSELEKRRNNILVKIVKKIVEHHSQSCLFVVDKARNVDTASWNFLAHLLRSGNLFICFSIRSINSNELVPSASQVCYATTQFFLYIGKPHFRVEPRVFSESYLNVAFLPF